jgi:hypothetical protein
VPCPDDEPATYTVAIVATSPDHAADERDLIRPLDEYVAQWNS